MPGVIQGGCLCGGIRFQVTNVVGPLELCHCPRCRKTTGSAFAATVVVAVDGYALLRGEDLIREFAMPANDQPPGYTVHFCCVCGCFAPDPRPTGDRFEIACGLFDDDLPVGPDRHIYCDSEYRANCYTIEDNLPQYTKAQIAGLRERERTS